MHGIRIAPKIADIVIEKNNISGWGRVADDGWGLDRDAAVSTDNVDNTGLRRIINQYNKMHHPQSHANNWKQYRSNRSGHPVGRSLLAFISSNLWMMAFQLFFLPAFQVIL